MHTLCWYGYKMLVKIKLILKIKGESISEATAGDSQTKAENPDLGMGFFCSYFCQNQRMVWIVHHRMVWVG